MIKFLVLLFLLMSGFSLASSPDPLRELRCSGGQACFSRHLTALAQAEDEIFQSLNKQFFPDLLRYDSVPVSFCDPENKHCMKPAVLFYRQRDTGEKFLIVDGLNDSRPQIMSLLNPQWQQERLYHVVGAFFTGYRLSDAGLQIRYLRCSRHVCREKTQVVAVKQVHYEY
ncbi:hypothetical protein [Thalassomonas haliotis]|uniref:Secreted protein n=1 Tax=Thalassomonas haliotis TaxID=485448 RepID=A0ABY7VC91_9GAMM|nr:hypothetical protein [Thalassomonas haliotis]WDE10512.1 hypothetical protein H3N35_19925 [Thalassomonas haliotis]